MQIVGIERGDDSTFRDPPFYDRVALERGATDRIVLASFSLSDARSCRAAGARRDACTCARPARPNPITKRASSPPARPTVDRSTRRLSLETRTGEMTMVAPQRRELKSQRAARVACARARCSARAACSLLAPASPPYEGAPSAASRRRISSARPESSVRLPRKRARSATPERASRRRRRAAAPRLLLAYRRAPLNPPLDARAAVIDRRAPSTRRPCSRRCSPARSSGSFRRPRETRPPRTTQPGSGAMLALVRAGEPRAAADRGAAAAEATPT